MEFAELFTQGARDVLPVARRKHLITFFDYVGPRVQLPAVDRGIRSAIYRILRGMVDCLDDGFVMFTAEASAPVDGQIRVFIHAAGAGTAPTSNVSAVLARLGLQPDRQPVTADAMPSAEGVCPATGGRTQFVDAGRDGIVLSVELHTQGTEVESAESEPNACGTRVWLISPVHGALDSVGRRLRRLGWSVRTVDSVAEALRHLEDPANRTTPKLLIAAEADGGELDALERISHVSPSVWAVLAVVAGSSSLPLRSETTVDIRVLPLSPAELHRFTAHVDERTSTEESRETAPVPLYEHEEESRRVLVVDDSVVNQLIARGQLELLGYDVVVASDGAEAVDTCRDQPPDMVLMDLDMPVMDGLEATAWIRTKQQEGVVPPFPIVAATSRSEAREACIEAGMDGFLSKPIELRALANELDRMLPARPKAT